MSADTLDRAFYAAVDQWVAVLATRPTLSSSEALAERARVFARPAALHGVFAVDARWSWRCFRHWHPYLSILGPGALTAFLVNTAWGLLQSGW